MRCMGHGIFVLNMFGLYNLSISARLVVRTVLPSRIGITCLVLGWSFQPGRALLWPAALQQ